ncbi:hypothetical protein A3F29_02985 [Candidatus Roizmanbacteria bacterium RIFCSPHIGHO2_12_FULL_33_9]|uniref:Uncharacterized protein n=1 Tax=Candidatus Roizmanbacteria bacterium RIFCSPHIGHO2_12_FULL_33_9 TaxID=1802045 RepID=A0A1F7HI81_9BACT|nr:MAG: hypothetical protein A3F29_02985 [Candidatus Roizmanbacteria bacterium RIFCSPHIGHO2_12_FULL_33_9]
MSVMKRIIYILIVFLLLFSPAHLIAQNNKNIKQRTTERRTEIQEKRLEDKEQFALQRVEFKSRVSEIRDKNKRAIVERIDNKITTLNKKHTDRFANLLEKLSSILDRIELKTAELDENDIEVSSVNVLVQIARDAIEVAQTEVEEQAGKDYVFEIGDESTLGQVISSAFSEFRKDMKTLLDSVKVAKEAVHESAVALKDLIISSSIEDGSAE